MTGVMTFIVNQDGIVREKDLDRHGPRRGALAAYNADNTSDTAQ